MTTFRIGGPAQFFCSVTDEKELVDAEKFADENNLEIFVLGGGSNVLISDEGYRGLVIKMEIKGVEFIEDGDITQVIARAGENWDDLVRTCVDRGLYGIENLSYIPGTVGAAPVQNIGAYGVEIKDVLERVRVYDTTQGVFVDFSSDDCQFEYRNSIFKRERDRYIITEVVLSLRKNSVPNLDYKDLVEYFSLQSNPTLLEVRNAVIEIRKRKLPNVSEIGTAGSFFKNPIVAKEIAEKLKKEYPDLPLYPVDDEYVKISLGWVIDKVCKFKGVGKGDVGTYKSQALVLVNNGSATARDVKDFASEIERIVFEKTNIQIESEVLFI